ncbi:alpha/beta fold hydrolase [Lamprocystis purpurea]|jgi:pimeloyl-ACP methyl ester carboxylesterase|uniref:alpha/beta fold hydrolase n=1 Tax=Lamprocystis purpurea TaxID=61598 RepID=UPI00038000C9|nr:alpha/beta fold hydrolase [Lamprocystis purpurea]
MTTDQSNSSLGDLRHQRTPATVHPLADALDAPRKTFSTRAGQRLAYYVDGPAAGTPLVLIHSINAAPSSYEMKPLFDHYRAQRPVYSLDLPGFGQSERPAGPYTPGLFADAIGDFLTQVVAQPAAVVALSLSAEFTARAAAAVPDLVASLVLISPTGFSRRPLPSAAAARGVHRVLTTPGLSQWLYDLVASRPSIRYFLNKSFTTKAPDDLIDYAYATSHQPGARHAPLYFLSTQLFTPQAADRLYAGLKDLPVLVIADRDPYVDFAALPDFVAAHPNWRHETLAPQLGLPQWEHPAATRAVLDRFWNQRAFPIPA